MTKCARSFTSTWIASSSVAMAEGESCDVLSMFVDDFAQEIELNPDSEEDSSSESKEESPTPQSRSVRRRLPSTQAAERKGSSSKGKQKKAKGKMLLKSERERITDDLLRLERKKILDKVRENMNSQLHLQAFPARQTFWMEFSCSDVFADVVAHLQNAFVEVYRACDKGRDKFLRFQLEWYTRCSSTLLVESDTCCIHESWKSYRDQSGVAVSVWNPVIVSVCACVYDFMMKVLSEKLHMEHPQSSACTSTSIPDEPEEVYYRFCGAALASMLHTRYEKVKSAPGKYNSIYTEINILKAIECQDKSIIPANLQYRDRGHMYFPDPLFLPFLKAVDNCILEVTNQQSLEKHGKNLVEVAMTRLKQKTELRERFEQILTQKLKISHIDTQAELNSVYSELVRKLGHTRIQEFIDSYKQSTASKQGSATLKGQNLRDTLLSQHVNLQTHQ